MYGKLFKEWMLFLKERKLYSKFIIHYQAANASVIAFQWQEKKIYTVRIFRGHDYIFPTKSNSLDFQLFLCCIRTIEWYCPFGWVDLATMFGELKGYIKKEKKSQVYYDGCYTISYSEPKQTNYREKEVYGKWYDIFNGVSIKNRYRR